MKSYCIHGQTAELKRITDELMDLNEIKCSRCERYGTPSQGCFNYVTIDHLEKFREIFSLELEVMR